MKKKISPSSSCGENKGKNTENFCNKRGISSAILPQYKATHGNSEQYSAIFSNGSQQRNAINGNSGLQQKAISGNSSLQYIAMLRQFQQQTAISRQSLDRIDNKEVLYER